MGPERCRGGWQGRRGLAVLVGSAGGPGDRSPRAPGKRRWCRCRSPRVRDGVSPSCFAGCSRLVGRERCWVQRGFSALGTGSRWDRFSAASPSGSRGARAGAGGGPRARRTCGSLPLPSLGSRVHLRLHRGSPHPAAALVPPGPHVLPVPLLLPPVPDPQPVCECPPSPPSLAPAHASPSVPRAPVPLCWVCGAASLGYRPAAWLGLLMDVGTPSRAGLCRCAPLPSTHQVLPGCAIVVVSPRPSTNRLPCSPHSSGGRFSSPCTVMCGVELCFKGRGPEGKGTGS